MTVYACPHNGEVRPCATCHVPVPHRIEMTSWGKPPRCPEHDCRLRPAGFARRKVA